MNERKKGGGKEEQWVRLDGKRRRPHWGLSRGTWFGCSKHSSSSSSSPSPSTTSSLLVGGWSRMLLLLLLLLQRTTVAGCRCTREERTKAEDEQWCRRWVVDFLRSTYNEATVEETVQKGREREREEYGQATGPRPIPELPGEHPVAGASQPADSTPQKEPSRRKRPDRAAFDTLSFEPAPISSLPSLW